MDAADKEPELGIYLPIVGAVMELSTERQIGMSVGQIPVSAINRYIKENQLPDWWAPVITGVDMWMLKDMNDEGENAQSSA